MSEPPASDDERSGETRDQRSGETRDQRSGETRDQRSGETRDQRSGETRDQRTRHTRKKPTRATRDTREEPTHARDEATRTAREERPTRAERTHDIRNEPTHAVTPEPSFLQRLHLGRWLPFLLVGVAFGLGRWTASPGNDTTTASDEESTWTCAMHPQIRQPDPGQCPLCGMDLVPVGDTETLGPERVRLSERARTLAEIRTTPVRRLDSVEGSVRLLGRVDFDETTLHTVTSWIAGRVDRLLVDTTGARIRRGQPVARLYSPEVYAAHGDLLAAKRQLDRLAGASPLARSAAEASFEAAQSRLRLLGVPAASVARMTDARNPTRSVTITSPFAGTVVERLASAGAYVETGAPLYRLADLDRLWVQLDAYESDLAQLTVGQTVALEVDALPGETLDGRITFIDPVVDPERRTARVRVAISNDERRLRPGMFVEATVRSDADAAQPLVVPASAPLFTGRRSLVYLSRGDGEYEAREIRLGARLGDVYPVVAGLTQGDEVVTHGAFAIDADLQIRGGRSMMTRGDDDDPGAFELAAELPADWRAPLAAVVDAYLQIQVALAEDDADAARTHARDLVARADEHDPETPAKEAELWTALRAELRMRGTHVGDAVTIEEARRAFEPLSATVARLLRVFGNPGEQTLRLAHCPMAFDNRGAAWIQAGEVVDNAYFGAAMRTCGTIEEEIAPGAHLPVDEP